LPTSILLKETIQKAIYELGEVRQAPSARQADVQALLSLISSLKKSLKESKDSLEYHYPGMVQKKRQLKHGQGIR
jgi:hypothetical protein